MISKHIFEDDIFKRVGAPVKMQLYFAALADWASIWCWDSSSGAVGSVEYPSIAINPRFALSQSGSIC